MNRIVVVLVIAFLFSCSPYPRVSYYELDEAIANAKTEEEREFHKSRQRHIEKTAEEAVEFLAMLERCIGDSHCMIVCTHTGAASGPRGSGLDLERQDLSDIEKLTKWYRKVKPPTCGFATDMNKGW